MTTTQEGHRRGVQSPPEPVRSIRRASVTGGVALLVMTPLAVFANFIALRGLVTPGDPVATAADILSSEDVFLLGLVSWVLVVILDVVVAWALQVVFEPVSQGLSRLAAWFRLAYAAILLVAVSQLVGVPDLLKGRGHLSVFGADQLQAQALERVSAFNDIYNAGLVLFGAHLLVVGYLAYRSHFIPRWLGVLIAIAGFGYVFDGLSEFLSTGTAISIAGFTFIGEFLLALWLVIWGRRLTLPSHVTAS